MQIFALSSVTLISLVIGVLVGKNSIRSGQYFANALVGTAAFGPLMYGGFTWYDESFLTGFLGCMLFYRIKFPIKASIRKQKIYFSFLIYFTFEFLNGIYYFQNNNEDFLRKFRWLLLLALLSTVFSLGNLDKSKNFVVTIGHLRSIVLFLIAYLVTNYVVLLETGSAGYAQYAQVPERGYIDAIWANTAYVTLSIFIFIYIAMIGLIQRYSTKTVTLCKFTLFLSSLIFGLTLSRGGFFLSILLLGAFLISQAGWKSPINSFIILSIMTVPMIIGLNASGKGNLSGFASDIKNTVLVPLDENRSTGRESDRIKQYTQLTKVIGTPDSESQVVNDSESQVVNDSESQVVNDSESQVVNLWHNLFGYGLRTSGPVLALANNDPDQSNYSLSFAPSVLIEFGLIGAVLFLLIIFEGIQSLFRSKSKEKLLILSLILGAVLTTFVVNNFDYIPLYMLLSSTIYLSKSDS
jgi:hypothetical protein